MRNFLRTDWILFGATIPLVVAGLSVLASFGAETQFFSKQIVWISISFTVFFIFSNIDWRFLREARFTLAVYVFAFILLATVSLSGTVIKGAQSWFDFGSFSLQPAEFMKLALIIVLAKYFSRRHIEIARIRHIFISGCYALVPFLLLLIQPDFGSAVIMFLIWLGTVSLSGISRKHLLFVFGCAAVSVSVLWFFVFSDYQKARIISFVHPLADIRSSGYNAFQSMIAVGSGEILGKGIGYGTQSRLQFLPEYETDFVFAAFAEEWGLIGSILIFIFYGIVIWRILRIGREGETNFESLFALGAASFFIGHFFVNIGMNIGLLPVTGVTLPFLSYGGSHLLMEYITLGVLVGISRRARKSRVEPAHQEIVL